jgi:hypothetical protein
MVAMLYEPILREQALRVFRTYQSEAGIAAHAAASAIARDSKILTRLEQGEPMSVRTYDRIVSAAALLFEERGFEWPADVPRPSRQDAEAVVAAWPRKGSRQAVAGTPEAPVPTPEGTPAHG